VQEKLLGKWSPSHTEFLSHGVHTHTHTQQGYLMNDCLRVFNDYIDDFLKGMYMTKGKMALTMLEQTSHQMLMQLFPNRAHKFM